MLGDDKGGEDMESIMEQLQDMLEERVSNLMIQLAQDAKAGDKGIKSDVIEPREQGLDEDCEGLNLLAQQIYKAGFCDALKLMKAFGVQI